MGGCAGGLCVRGRWQADRLAFCLKVKVGQRGLESSVTQVPSPSIRFEIGLCFKPGPIDAVGHAPPLVRAGRRRTMRQRRRPRCGRPGPPGPEAGHLPQTPASRRRRGRRGAGAGAPPPRLPAPPRRRQGCVARGRARGRRWRGRGRRRRRVRPGGGGSGQRGPRAPGAVSAGQRAGGRGRRRAACERGPACGRAGVRACGRACGRAGVRSGVQAAHPLLHRGESVYCKEGNRHGPPRPQFHMFQHMFRYRNRSHSREWWNSTKYCPRSEPSMTMLISSKGSAVANVRSARHLLPSRRRPMNCSSCS